MHLWLHTYVVKLHYGSDVAIDGCIAKMHVIHMSSVQLYVRSTTLRAYLLASYRYSYNRTSLLHQAF